jgi:hypothetical protein
MLVNLADTAANRAFFSSTGTADGSAPFPRLRVVAVTARAGRAVLGPILGQAGTGEQTLLKRLARRRPELFAGLVICFDRNFPGHGLITAILDAGGHVVARVKKGISLPLEDGPGRGWLPDRSRLTWLNAPSGKKADRLPVRAAEHNGPCPPATGRKSRQRPARSSPPSSITRLRPPARSGMPISPGGAHRRPRSGKTRPRLPGPGTAPPAPSCGRAPPRLVIQEAWAWLTATQLVRASKAAALRSEQAAARALRRRSRQQVTADEESFTAALRHAIRSMTSTQVTAVSSPQAITAAADASARAALHTLNIPGRERHCPRTQKARPKFPHTAVTKTTATGKPQITVFAPGFS